MLRAATAALLAAALASHASAQVGPSPASCSGTVNTYAPWTDMTFVNKTTVSATGGGLKFTMNQPGSDTPVTVLHLYGSPYDMGHSYGILMRREISTLVPAAIEYLRQTINASLPTLPPAIRNAILEQGLDFALNLTANVTKPYTPQHFLDTMQGMADGSGVDYADIVSTNLIPELIKAQCSIMGAWGPATANSTSTLVGLRALDWDTDGPFNWFNQLTVYHPLAGDGVPFASLGWSGFVGALTGFSSNGISVHEKVYDAYTGLQNIVGKPWTFVLSDILQYATDLDDALSQVATVERTCAIWVGLGSRTDMKFNILQYSYDYVNIFNYQNFPVYPPAHPYFQDALFVDKHVQPSQNECFGDLMTWLYGSISPTTTFKYITALEQTGDMHWAVFDFASDFMYFSVASIPDAANNGTITMAYDRQPFSVNMTAMWNMPLTAY